MEKRSNRKVSYSNSLTHSSLLWDFASSSTLIFSISALISLPLPKDSLSFFHPKKNKQHYLPRMLPACDLDKVAVQEPFVSSQCSLHRTSHDCCTRLFTALGLCINHCTFQALNGGVHVAQPGSQAHGLASREQKRGDFIFESWVGFREQLSHQK